MTLVVVIVVGMIAGCAHRATDSAAVSESPQRGGTLRLMQAEPASLDPMLSNSVYTSLPVNQIFDGLVATDTLLRVRPALAASWRVDRDGLRYEFELRRGVRFHDGTPLTADDVTFSLQRALAPEFAGESLAFPYLLVVRGAADYTAGRTHRLEGVRALDRHTVEIELERPTESFLSVLAMDGALILPRHIVERKGAAAFGREPVGTGPFLLDGWTADGLRLVPNESYFRGRAHLEAVEIVFADPGDDIARESGLIEGRIDAAVPSVTSIPRLDARPEVRLHRYQELSLRFLGVKMHRPPLNHDGLRQAIAHAIRRDQLVADASSDRQQAYGVLPPGLFGFSPESKALTHDPERARRLLAANGNPGGAGLPVLPIYTTVTSDDPARPQSRIAADLAAVGIPTEVRPVDWSGMLAALDGDEPGLFLLSWVADTPDPESFLRSLFAAGGSANFWGYRDDETESLLASVGTEPDPSRRRELYRRLERRILEMAPLVPLFHPRGALAMREEVRGLAPGALGLAMVELERVWLAGERAG